jgi:hypothetical protein
MLFALLNEQYHVPWLAIIAMLVMFVHVTLFNVGPGAILWFIWYF